MLQVLAVAENLGVLTVLVLCRGIIQFRRRMYLSIYLFLFLLVLYSVTYMRLYVCMQTRGLKR